VTPSAKREVLGVLVHEHGLPVRRACQAVRLSRAAYYRPPGSRLQQDADVVTALNDVVARHDPAAPRLRTDGEADLCRVPRRHGEARAASQQKLRIVAGFGVSLVEAGDRPGYGKQERKRPQQCEDAVVERIERRYRGRQPQTAFPRLIGPRQRKLHPRQLRRPVNPALS